MGDDGVQTGSAEVRLDRVPRSAEEVALLLSTEPPGWEYLLFAAVLFRRNQELEPRWLEQDEGSRRAGPVLTARQAQKLISGAPERASQISESIISYLDPQIQEDAFGRPGESGDPQRIRELGEGFMDACEAFLEWAASLRATGVPSVLRRAYDLLSEMARLPLQQIREFIDDLIEQFDDIPAAIRESRPISLRLTLTLDSDDAVVREFEREMKKASRRI